MAGIENFHNDKITMDSYGPGDVILIVDSWGSGPRYMARVETHEEDVKNGRPGGSGKITTYPGRVDSGGKWWYDYQVVRVVSRAKKPMIETYHIKE